MTDGMTPSQFQILREDLQAMRTEWNQRFDNLITRDTFADERRRVDGRFTDEARRADERHTALSREIGELSTALATEAQTRQNERVDTLNRQAAQANEREKERRARMWQWLLTGATLVLSPIVAALIASAMAGIGGP